MVQTMAKWIETFPGWQGAPVQLGRLCQQTGSIGLFTGGVQVLELAKSRGIATVLITRYTKSPAAKLADVALCCGSNEGPFQLGSIPARVAQLVLMDILFQEFCQKDPQRCSDSIQRIAAALSEKHV